MDLTKPAGVTLGGGRRWPNLFRFPRALRDAIPDYGDRVLAFDAVSGSTSNFPAEISGLGGVPLLESTPRAQAHFLVHETGNLDGKYVISADLDAVTMRALGRFLVELADRAESQPPR
ncbi:MAG: hypothetical protein R2762_23365 [Bryobacteraceae bacterium]